jgi:hypothetical protein
MLARVEKLPSALRRALFELGYRSNTVNLSACKSVGLSNPANDYARSFAGTVDLVSGKSEIQWSGFDDAERDDPFPSNPTVGLDQSLAVIKGSNENNTTYAYIFLHPNLAEKFRSVPVPLTPLQSEVLYTYANIISKYRKGRLIAAQKKYIDEPFDQAIDDLIRRGFLKRYSNGSIRITTSGRIALDSIQS